MGQPCPACSVPLGESSVTAPSGAKFRDRGERTQKAALTLEVLASALGSGGIQSSGVHGEREQQEHPWLGKPGGQVLATMTLHGLAADLPSWMEPKAPLCPVGRGSSALQEPTWGARCPVETDPSTHSRCLHSSCWPSSPLTLRPLQPGSQQLGGSTEPPLRTRAPLDTSTFSHPLAARQVLGWAQEWSV